MRSSRLSTSGSLASSPPSPLILVCIISPALVQRMEDSDLDALLASDDFEDSLLAQLDEDEQRQSTVPVEPEPTTEGEPPRDWRDGNDAYQPTGFGQIGQSSRLLSVRTATDPVRPDPQTGNFMRNKRVKLQHQYQARLAESPASVAEQGPPQFFKGVAIHVSAARAPSRSG